MHLGSGFLPLRMLCSEVTSAARNIRRATSTRVSGRPAEAVRLFFRLIDQGRYRDAIHLFPETIIRSVGIDRLESMLYADSAELRARGGVLSVDVLRDSCTSREAEVGIAIRYGDGSVDDEAIALTNERGEWKIDVTR